MFAERVAAPAGFHADQFHRGIRNEGVEEADGIAAAADAGDQRIGQAAFGFENLPARFLADHLVKIAHHHGVRVRAERAAQQVIGLADVGDPVAHGFADGVFERGAAAGDALHLGAEHAHAEDIEALPPHVLFAHVDHAFEAEQRADRGGGHAVLSRAGLGDDAALAHAAGEQRLSQAVIDLVRAGVQQVFALEPDARAAQSFGQVFGEVERRGAAGVIVQQVGELGLKVPDRRAPPDTRSRVLRSAPSGLRGRSARRRVRSVRRHRVAKSCAERRLGREQKVDHFHVVLYPRRRLDARARIDAPGLGERDGARHVGGIEAAGQDDAMTGVAGQCPIEGLPGAAVEFGSGAIEQQGFGGSVIQLRKIEAGCDAGRFPDGERGRIVSGGFVAVQLRHVERRDACDDGDALRRLIDEHADAADARRWRCRRPVRARCSAGSWDRN